MEEVAGLGDILERTRQRRFNVLDMLEERKRRGY